jgi:hypothetical protein
MFPSRCRVVRRRRKPKIPLRNPQPVEEIVPSHEAKEINSSHPGWYDAEKMSEMEAKIEEDRFGFKKMTNEQLDELARKIWG